MKMRMFYKAVQMFLLTGLMLLPLSGAQAADRFKPFVLASKGPGDFDAKIQESKDALKAQGFEVIGEYSPYQDTFVDRAHVIIVTNDELKKVALKSEQGAFAAPWRIGITQVGGEIQVAYPNPAYLSLAYRLKSDLAGVGDALGKALGNQETFGSKKGLTERKLKKYHYTFGMEYFTDPYELAEHDSQQAAIDALEKNLAAGVAGVTKVYRLDLSNNVSVFGVARKAGADGDEAMDENWIMNNVDFSDLKGTAYLPYEIVVEDGKSYALHMRFRMAVHYPDLKMMGQNSFMNIMPSPAANEKALKEAAGGKAKGGSN